MKPASCRIQFERLTRVAPTTSRPSMTRAKTVIISDEHSRGTGTQDRLTAAACHVFDLTPSDSNIIRLEYLLVTPDARHMSSRIGGALPRNQLGRNSAAHTSKGTGAGAGGICA